MEGGGRIALMRVNFQRLLRASMRYRISSFQIARICRSRLTCLEPPPLAPAVWISRHYFCCEDPDGAERPVILPTYGFTEISSGSAIGPSGIAL